jgi:ankyrin repeat protein
VFQHGYTLLHLAAELGFPEGASLLIQSLESCLQSMASSAQSIPQASGSNSGFQSGVSRGMVVDVRTPDGRTPLFIAARNGRETALSFLLASGASVDTAKTDSWTVMHAASAGGHAECVRLLIAAGSTQVNAVYGPAGVDLGWTPLIKAAGEGKLECVRILAEAGAYLDAQRDDGATGLHWASAFGRADCIALLVGLGADRTRRLCDSKYTPLHEAARNGHLAAVSCLCAGMDAAALASYLSLGDQSGCTALHLAAEARHDEVCSLLITLGADPNALNSRSQTPLHRAAEVGALVCVRALLDAGARPDTMDAEGRSPLDVANGQPVTSELRRAVRDMRSGPSSSSPPSSSSSTATTSKRQQVELTLNGFLYRGEALEGRPHGRGKMYRTAPDVLSSGGTTLVFEGQFKNGQRNGLGTLVVSARDNQMITCFWSHGAPVWDEDVEIEYGDGESYRGPVDPPLAADAQGEAAWASGSAELLRGLVRSGGLGKMRLSFSRTRCPGAPRHTPLRAKYFGGYFGNRRNGFGIEYNPFTGSTYCGQWLNDQRHGPGGVQIDADGTVFTGTWNSGHRSGRGTLYGPTGMVIEGEWSSDERFGNALLTKRSEDDVSTCARTLHTGQTTPFDANPILIPGNRWRGLVDLLCGGDKPEGSGSDQGASPSSTPQIPGVPSSPSSAAPPPSSPFSPSPSSLAIPGSPGPTTTASTSTAASGAPGGSVSVASLVRRLLHGATGPFRRAAGDFWAWMEFRYLPVQEPYAASLALALDDIFSFAAALLGPVRAQLGSLAPRDSILRGHIIEALTVRSYPEVLRPLYRLIHRKADMETFLKLKGLAPAGPEDFGVRSFYLPKWYRGKETFRFQDYFAFAARVTALLEQPEWLAATLGSAEHHPGAEDEAEHLQLAILALVRKEREADKAFDELASGVLFFKSIAVLLGLPILTSPRGKSRFLHWVNETMKAEVDDNYFEHSNSNSNSNSDEGAEKRVLGGDDYVPVFSLIFSHAALPNVNAELAFLSDFVSSGHDFMLTQLLANLECLRHMDYLVRDSAGYMVNPGLHSDAILNLITRSERAGALQGYPVLALSELFVLVSLQVQFVGPDGLFDVPAAAKALFSDRHTASVTLDCLDHLCIVAAQHGAEEKEDTKALRFKTKMRQEAYTAVAQDLRSFHEEREKAIRDQKAKESDRYR